MEGSSFFLVAVSRKQIPFPHGYLAPLAQNLREALLDDLVHLPEPCQHRRARREDRRPVDLVNPVGANRGDRLPARAAADRVEVRLLAAPRDEDDPSIAANHLVGLDDTAGCQRVFAQLREHVLTAGDLDDLGHPPDPGDQRVVPLLEVHPGSARPHARELTDLPELVPHVLDGGARLTLPPEGAADQEDRPEDVVERALVRAEDGHAGADQVPHDIGLEVGKREDQVWLERENLVEPERRESADLRLLAGLRRPARRTRHADHPLAGADERPDLDGLRREADDAFGKLSGARAVHPTRFYARGGSAGGGKWRERSSPRTSTAFQNEPSEFGVTCRTSGGI